MTIDYRPPNPDEFVWFREELVGLLWKTTWRLADRDDASRPESPGVPSLDLQDRRDSYLALLNTIGVTNAVLDSLEKEAARRAGQMGAGYPDLADAWKVTRQGARRRWPDAVAGPDDGPLRQALAAVVEQLSSRALQPSTAAAMFAPMIAAAGARDGSSSDAVAEAATKLLGVPPPAPEDRDIVVPLLDKLRGALEEFQASGTRGGPGEPSAWRRFLDPSDQERR